MGPDATCAIMEPWRLGESACLVKKETAPLASLKPCFPSRPRPRCAQSAGPRLHSPLRLLAYTWVVKYASATSSNAALHQTFSPMRAKSWVLNTASASSGFAPTSAPTGPAATVAMPVPYCLCLNLVRALHQVSRHGFQPVRRFSIRLQRIKRFADQPSRVSA
jgi:hypothetical protein